MSNPAEKAGFSVKGKILKGSVTRIISEEMEKTKAKVLEESVRGNGNMALYLNHRQASKDAIVPDILVHDFPPDNNANGNTVVPAIFDIKTVRIDKRRVRYRVRAPGKSATDRGTLLCALP